MKSDLKDEVSSLNAKTTIIQQEKKSLNDDYEKLNKGNKLFLFSVFFKCSQFDFLTRFKCKI